MDYLCKDVLNIIGEYANGDKKYWKAQYDDVIYENLDCAIRNFDMLIRINGFQDLKYENVKYFMRFLKIYQLNPRMQPHRYNSIYHDPYIFNADQYI